jgi:aminocarboxymuconate-semialdehyde decarboxylase
MAASAGSASVYDCVPSMAAPTQTELIDIHTHVVPQAFPPYIGRHAGAPWPSMRDAQPCHKHVMISGANYRTVSHQCWDCSVRLKDMAQQRVTRQVLSPMPELLSTWMQPEDGAAMCRYLNEVIATLVRQAPAQFIGLGAVPLQDVALAIRELEFAMREFGMAGVEIATHVNGVPIGDPKFLPFFEAAVALGAAVFVHPLRPVGMERLRGPPLLEQVLAFPGETGLAAASMITGGTLARVPGLRIAFSHGGGSFQALLPRLRHGWRHLPPVRDALQADPLIGARQMFYDDLVYDAATISRLIDVFGASQVMVGSDYPFAIMDPDPDARSRELKLTPDELQGLRCGNAKRWLALPSDAAA